MGKCLLGIGECMVELSSEAPGLWRQGFAGDVFNTLWYARAGLDQADTVAFHTGIGTDVISGEFERFLAEHRIDPGDSPRFDDRTLGLYAIHLHEGERSFSYWRDTSAARRLADDTERLARRVRAADLVYLSGITLAILSPERLDALHGLLVDARASTRIVFDPNIRPRLWADARTMRDAIERMAGSAHVVLPGLDDEAQCFGSASGEAVADRYLALGAERVIVKEAGRRVRVRGDSRIDFLFEPIPAPLDTTAAGDAFAGAYLAATLAGQDIEGALEHAHACAAKVIMTRGALCPHDELPSMT